MTEYTEGQTVIIQGTFRDQNGDLIDPGSVTLTVRAPDGTVTTPAHVNISTGVYEASVLLDQDGVWRWQWEGTTTSGSAIDEGSICAKRSSVVLV